MTHTNPTDFCVFLLTRDLANLKSAEISTKYWPVIERILDRANELERPFKEIVEKYGYEDHAIHKTENSQIINLILQQLYFCSDYVTDAKIEAKEKARELGALNKEISKLATLLAGKLKRQGQLYCTSGITQQEHQFFDELIKSAGQKNPLYQSFVSEHFERLTAEFDQRYWPTRIDVLDAIVEFETKPINMSHDQFPDEVLNGRKANFKDFILSFDAAFTKTNCLPSTFRFSNEAMADIANVILEATESPLTGEIVRLNRNRYKQLEQQKQSV